MGLKILKHLLIFFKKSLYVGVVVLCPFKFSIADEYYSRKEEGWFWYEVVEDEQVTDDILEQTKNNETKNLNQENDKQSKKMPIVNFIGEDGLYKAEILNKIIPQALNKALDNPTYQNVEHYYFLQKMAMDKSQNFEVASQRIPLINPVYDELRLREQSINANFIKFQNDKDLLNDRLKEISKKAGIFFFYKSTCNYCHLAKRQVEMLSNLNFKVYGISLDNNKFNDLNVIKNEFDKNLRTHFSIKSVPSFVLVAPLSEKKFTVLSSSFINDNLLINRIVQGAYLLDILNLEK